MLAALQYWRLYWPQWPGVLLVVAHAGVSAAAAVASAAALRLPMGRVWLKAAVLAALWACVPGLAQSLAVGAVGPGGVCAGAVQWGVLFFIPALLLAGLRWRPSPERAQGSQPANPAAALFASEPATGVGRKLAAALAGYALLSVALTWPAARRFAVDFIAYPGDSWQTAWNLWWFDKAVFQWHVNPYWTPLLFHPVGSSLLLHTLQPLHGLLAAGLVRTAGLVPAYNALVFFSFVATGLGMFGLALAVTGRAGPAFVAGALFTACPFHMFKCYGHLNFAAAEWLPLFVLAFVKMHASANWRWPLLAAGALFLNWTCCWYYTTYCFLFCAFFWAYLALAAGRPSAWTMFSRRCAGFLCRARHSFAAWAVVVAVAVAVPTVFHSWPVHVSRALAVAAAAAAAVRLAQVMGRRWLVRAAVFAAASAVLVGPPFAMALLRRHEFVLSHAPSANSCDLLALFAPGTSSTYRDLIPGLAERLGVNWSDRSSPLGLVALALAVLGMRRHAANRTGPWLAVGVAFLVLSFGPMLQVGGRNVVGMPYRLLWAAFPPLHAAGVPGRMSYMATLCFMLLAGLGLAGLRGSPRRRSLVCAAALALGLLEFLCIPPPFASAHVPAFYYRLARDPERYAILDTAFAQDMFFQTVHGKPLVGGYVSRLPKDAAAYLNSNPLLAELAGPVWFRRGRLAAKPSDLDILRRSNVRYIIDHQGRYRRGLQEGLGLRPCYADEEVEVYDLRRSRP